MSNGNTSPEHSQKFSTATVGIFSPDMTQTLLVCNDRIGALVPPGGKWKPTDVNVYHTGLRELWEEAGIDLPITPWDWLDIDGNVIDYQKIVQICPFRIGQQDMIDHLFLFRMQGRIRETYTAERVGKWYKKEDLKPETIVFKEQSYKILVPWTREVILDLLW